MDDPADHPHRGGQPEVRSDVLGRRQAVKAEADPGEVESGLGHRQSPGRVGSVERLGRDPVLCQLGGDLLQERQLGPREVGVGLGDREVGPQAFEGEGPRSDRRRHLDGAVG